MLRLSFNNCYVIAWPWVWHLLLACLHFALAGSKGCTAELGTLLLECFNYQLIIATLLVERFNYQLIIARILPGHEFGICYRLACILH